MKVCCRNCHFFQREVPASATLLPINIEYGECRRGRPSANFTEYRAFERVFPIVRVSDWCGEWQSADGEVL